MTLDDLISSLFRDVTAPGAPPMDGPGEIVRQTLAGNMPGMGTQRPAGGELAGPAMAGAPRGSMPPMAPSAPSMAPPQQPAQPAQPSASSFLPNPLSTFARGYKDGGLFGAFGNLSEEPQRLQAAQAQAAQEQAQAKAVANQTVQALIAKGVPPEIAAAVPGNPVLMKQLIETTFRAPEVEKPTSDMQNYEQAKRDGFAGTFMDYKTALNKAGAASTTIDMKQEGAYDKEVGGLLAKEFVDGQKSAATASRDLSNLAVMQSALNDPNLYTGTAGGLVQGVKKAASTLFGVDVKGLTSGEIMANLASEIAVSNKQKLPGPMSDADRQFLVDMAPNLTKSPDGNRAIIELGMAHKRWEVARGKAAREYAAQNGGRLDPGFYGAVSMVDEEAQAEIGGIMERLKGMGSLAPRPPTAGTPLGSDPLGLR